MSGSGQATLLLGSDFDFAEPAHVARAGLGVLAGDLQQLALFRAKPQVIFLFGDLHTFATLVLNNSLREELTRFL